MGISSVDGLVEHGGETKKDSPPTVLLGESLTFSVITGVGTGMVTMYWVLGSPTPGPGTVVVVAAICGVLVTLWGLIAEKAAKSTSTRLGRGDYFKRVIIGLPTPCSSPPRSGGRWRCRSGVLPGLSQVLSASRAAVVVGQKISFMGAFGQRARASWAHNLTRGELR